jgi:diacylglycerol O-acyltransferase
MRVETASEAAFAKPGRGRGLPDLAGLADERPWLSEATAAEPVPRRVLIISAEMGEGHNAAARALREAMAEMWPDCEVVQLDTMELRGRRFARAVRRSYRFQLEVVPWSYEALYAALCRFAWCAAVVRRATGWFFGRRLAPLLAGSEVDLVVSTYPFGSAALDWLRRSKKAAVPSVTYIPAFHVHPAWAYRGIDLHFVMYEGAADDARLPAAAPSFRLGAPPVRRGFGELRRPAARSALGLRRDAFVVLVTGGAWGLGPVREAVRALVELDPPVQVVAVCGKNADLRRALEGLGAPPDRLVVAGYVDTMPTLMSAADVVVTNGAGVTVLEALCSHRPVLAFDPLAGHGRASTAVMERLDLARRCDTPAQLRAEVERLRHDRTLLQRMERAGERLAARGLRDAVAEMATLLAPRGAEARP